MNTKHVKLLPQEPAFIIAENCPRALSTYLLCNQYIDGENNVFFEKNEITVDKSISWTKFRNDLKHLARLGLLEWHEISDGTNDGMHVNLAEYLA